MRFVTFAPAPGVERFGLVLAYGNMIDLEGAFAASLARELPTDRALALAHAMAPPNAQDFISTGRIALDAAKQAQRFAEEQGGAVKGPRGEKIVFAASDVTLLAPVPRPRKFIAAGKNYFEPPDEMGRPPTPGGNLVERTRRAPGIRSGITGSPPAGRSATAA